jgi:uncharacterized membrane protein
MIKKSGLLFGFGLVSTYIINRIGIKNIPYQLLLIVFFLTIVILIVEIFKHNGTIKKTRFALPGLIIIVIFLIFISIHVISNNIFEGYNIISDKTFIGVVVVLYVLFMFFGIEIIVNRRKS